MHSQPERQLGLLHARMLALLLPRHTAWLTASLLGAPARCKQTALAAASTVLHSLCCMQTAWQPGTPYAYTAWPLHP
jgi:hypothetical protein